MKVLAGLLAGGGLLLFAAMPATNNYELNNYGFGSGGGTMGTDNYSLEGIAGDLSAETLSSDNYGLHPGLLSSQLANLPGAPTFTNPANWYNRLHLVIDTAGNPSDTLFAVAISLDNFATTRYVQADDTVGNALGTEDFRDYADWGAGGGIDVVGLQPGTTYQVKVKAAQGEFSETGFGPEASAATVVPSIVFDIDISDTDSESAAPYAVEFGQVAPSTVTDAPDKVWIDIDSNAESGAFVYIVSQNNGLLSAVTNYTIDAVTGDLGAASEGIGAQNDSVTQAGGGPLGVASPFDGSSDDVGGVNDQFTQLLTTAAPLSGGRASFLLKIKTDTTTPAASDYVDIYTLIATARF